MKMKISPVIFSPYHNNVLDMVGRQLYAEAGQEVKITRAMNGAFRVYFDGKLVFEHDTNVIVSNFLNQHGVGFKITV